MTTGTRLAIGGAIIASVTGYMAYLGAASSWQYYLTVDECAEDVSALLNRSLRVSGRVALDSLAINSERTQACFVLQGQQDGLKIVCAGPLPDNLAEDMDVVVEGRLESADSMVGERVITRCASKYQSDEPTARTVNAAKMDREARR